MPTIAELASAELAPKKATARKGPRIGRIVLGVIAGLILLPVALGVLRWALEPNQTITIEVRHSP